FSMYLFCTFLSSLASTPDQVDLMTPAHKQRACRRPQTNLFRAQNHAARRRPSRRDRLSLRRSLGATCGPCARRHSTVNSPVRMAWPMPRAPGLACPRGSRRRSPEVKDWTSTIGRRAVALAAAAVVSAVASSGRAGPKVELDYDAAPGCPDVARFE